MAQVKSLRYRPFIDLPDGRMSCFRESRDIVEDEGYRLHGVRGMAAREIVISLAFTYPRPARLRKDPRIAPEIKKGAKKQVSQDDIPWQRQHPSDSNTGGTKQTTASGIH